MTGSTTPPRIERLPEVLTRVGASRSKVYAMIRDGSFPAPIPLGSSHCVGFLSSEIDGWIADRVREARPNADA